MAFGMVGWDFLGGCEGFSWTLKGYVGGVLKERLREGKNRVNFDVSDGYGEVAEWRVFVAGNESQGNCSLWHDVGHRNALRVYPDTPLGPTEWPPYAAYPLRSRPGHANYLPNWLTVPNCFYSKKTKRPLVLFSPQIPLFLKKQILNTPPFIFQKNIFGVGTFFPAVDVTPTTSSNKLYGRESKIAYSYTLMRLISTPQFWLEHYHPHHRALPPLQKREGRKKIIKFVPPRKLWLPRMPRIEKFNSFGEAFTTVNSEQCYSCPSFFH